MSYRYLEAKPLDAVRCSQIIQDRIGIMRNQYAVYETIIAAMAPFDGKAINKRIATAVQKALAELDSGFVVSWHGDSMFPKFYVWGAGCLDYDNRLVVNFNMHASKYCHADTIRAPSSEAEPYAMRQSPGTLWYLSQYPAQIAKMESELAELPTRIEAYNAARDAFNAARDAFNAALDGLGSARYFILEKFAR